MTPTPGRRQSPRRPSAAAMRYTALATRPLHVLVFLLPLIVAYEAGSYLWLANPVSGNVETIRAHSLLLGLFQSFGLGARSMPAVVLVAVLLVWQVLLKDRWAVRPAVLGGMAVESAAWTLPLLLLAALIQRSAVAATDAGAVGLSDLPWPSRLTISIGAGLYEEMLFRFVLIAGIHLLVVDLARAPDHVGRLVAVGVSAVAFVVYHDAGGWSLTPAAAALYLVAGVYFGILFLARGLAVCVGVHTLYDVAVLVILPASR